MLTANKNELNIRVLVKWKETFVLVQTTDRVKRVSKFMAAGKFFHIVLFVSVIKCEFFPDNLS